MRGGPNSWFADIARVATGRGDRDAAKRRLERHEDELAVFYGPWREARRQAAERAYEQEFASTRRGEILLERMDKFGLARFRSERALEANYEQRAISRTAGSAGYFVPPLWLLEDWAMAPRAGRPFADLWTPIPLPAGTDQINVPHWTTGLATGPSADGASVSTSSAADSFASSNVVTISGYQDVSMQAAEQTAQPGFDAFTFRDLMNDAAGQLDAQLLIGSGTGQLNGIIVAGAASASNLVTITNSQNVSGSTITVASGSTPVYTSIGHMLSVMSKARGLRATHIVMHEATWWDLAGSIATTGVPIVAPTGSAPEPGPDGALGSAYGLPVIGDNQLPLTFGGASAPSVSTSGAVTAATAGNGSYAVIAAVRAPDLYLFEGEFRVRVMQDVVSGTGQWRYQVHQYAAALRDRYTAGSTISITRGTDTGGVNSGGTPSAGLVTNYQANSPLASE
jgi:HK97 family phage major capsid protein